LLDAMIQSGAHCFAYETLEGKGGLPLLTPMSEVAGRMSIQVGAHYLERPSGGRGVLLGGVPGVEPGRVLILGGGTVGSHAALMAAGLGARVVLMDINLDRLRQLSETMPANVMLLHSNTHAIRQHLKTADLVVGAVLISGARAPVLVRESDLKSMKPGAVVVDVAVDQGGCIETCKPTTHANPTYEVSGVLHYCVANMPGAVSRTSTFALTNATLPYAAKLASLGPTEALRRNAALATAANVIAGKITHPGVASAFEMPFVEPAKAV
jgi:alanine dehydrogenase